MIHDKYQHVIAWFRDLGIVTKRNSVLNAKEILAALDRHRDEEGQYPDPLASTVQPTEAPLGRPWRLGLGLTATVTDDSRHEIDFYDKNTIGRLDTKQGRMSLEHKKLKPGTLLYVGFVSEGLEQKSGFDKTNPTPFNQIFYSALRNADSYKRATALTGLAARLSWGVVKEKVLAVADRSAEQIADRKNRENALAMVACQYPADRRPDSLEEAGKPARVLPPQMSVPVLEEGRHWGRFVMLRPGLRHAIAYLSAEAYIKFPVTVWRGFFKKVYFPAEVEVAPELMRLSLQEALKFDPAYCPIWEKWLQDKLQGSLICTELLALLEKRSNFLKDA